jgi:hypothetical protein
MVGIGCVFPEVVLELLDAHFSGDAGRFLNRNALVDALARAIFAPTMEGIPLRMLWTLVQRGVLPIEAVGEPTGPGASRVQLERLGETLKKLNSDGSLFRERCSDESDID